jgi:hypothetical protein
MTREDGMKKRNAPVLGLVALAGFLFFGQALSAHLWAAEVTLRDKIAYLAALRDAAVSEQREISRNLVAIVPARDAINKARLKGDSLVWEGDPGKSRILVATFMSRDSYIKYYKDNLEAGSPEYVLSKSLWVTATPELKNFFRTAPLREGSPIIPTAKRIKQLLGLHPAYDYEVIVEMFADPADLFRPAPDPEITDHEAELAIPPLEAVNYSVINGRKAWTFPRDQNPFLALRTDVFFKDSKWSPAQTYKEWFSDRADTIYTVGNENDPSSWGWPWTRLGYTYDWGNSAGHVGVSEFVLRVDPELNGGEAIVRLVRAVDSATSAWRKYFAVRAQLPPVTMNAE